MTSYVAVLPWIYQPYRDACLANCQLKVMEIDNTVRNIGIMKAHNQAIDVMGEADWLIIMSAAIRFGPAGGLDFVAQLDPEFICISATNQQTWADAQQVGIFGWHCIAFSKECLAKVGRWDENFTPYGFDDIDYSIRMQKAFPDPEYSRRTRKVACDISDTTMAHAIHLAGVTTDNAHHVGYLKQKWDYDVGGVNPIAKMFDHPFNNPANSLKYYPGGPDV